LGTLLYSAAVFGLQRAYLPDLDIMPIPALVALTTGIILVAAGLALYIAAIRQVRAALHQRRLVTDGVYAHVRHPIYASFTLLIVPGIAIMVRSVLGLSVPVVMYLLLRALIGKEEAHLERQFGDEYVRYRDRANLVFPRLRRLG